MIETYHGYNIWQNMICKWIKNPVSGHWYCENIPKRSFYISGPGAQVSQWFFSTKKCKEHIDFLISIDRHINEVRA